MHRTIRPLELKREALNRLTPHARLGKLSRAFPDRIQLGTAHRNVCVEQTRDRILRFSQTLQVSNRQSCR